MLFEERLYLKFIVELVETEGINIRAERAAYGTHLKGLALLGLRRRKTSPQRVIHHLLERHVVQRSLLTQTVRNILIECQCRSHVDIMMPLGCAVKMLLLCALPLRDKRAAPMSLCAQRVIRACTGGGGTVYDNRK